MAQGKIGSKGHTFITEIPDSQQPDRLVCPLCNGIWEGDERIGTSDNLEAHIMLGYDPKLCPDCAGAGRSDGEFDFDGDGE